jgi:hypothetical protein
VFNGLLKAGCSSHVALGKQTEGSHAAREKIVQLATDRLEKSVQILYLCATSKRNVYI